MAQIPDSIRKAAINDYANRKHTIRQLAAIHNVSYECMRRVIYKAGYSNGLKVR